MMVQVGVLEEIHQENLDDIPARKQWQVGFEVPRQPPGSIMDRLAGLSSSGNFPGMGKERTQRNGTSLHFQ